MAFDRLDSNCDGYLSLDELMDQLPANDGSSDAGPWRWGGVVGAGAVCLQAALLWQMRRMCLPHIDAPISCSVP